MVEKQGRAGGSWGLFRVLSVAESAAEERSRPAVLTGAHGSSLPYGTFQLAFKGTLSSTFQLAPALSSWLVEQRVLRTPAP